ncbi:MAG: VPLPA-CTERM sorting domain-containing protein [Sedimenticola sp.]
MRSTLLALLLMTLFSPASYAALVTDVWSGDVLYDVTGSYNVNDHLTWTISYDDSLDLDTDPNTTEFAFTPADDFYAIFENMHNAKSLVFDKNATPGSGKRTYSTSPGSIVLDWGTGSNPSSDGMGADTDLAAATFQIDQSIYSMGLYNVTVQTVPVPAAVWLFGSALAGLGFVTRKRKLA